MHEIIVHNSKLSGVLLAEEVQLHGFTETEFYNKTKENIVAVTWLEALVLVEGTDGHNAIRHYSELNQVEVLKEPEFMEGCINAPRQEVMFGASLRFSGFFVDTSMVRWRYAESLWRPKEVSPQWLTVYSTVDISVHSGLHFCPSLCAIGSLGWTVPCNLEATVDSLVIRSLFLSLKFLNFWK